MSKCIIQNAPVLHELGGQLHRVPLNAADAGDQALALLGEHVLRGVAKLVEERLDLAEGHERGRAADGRRLVADHVRDREADRLPGRREERALRADLRLGRVGEWIW